MAAADAFVPLADWLRAGAAASVPPPAAPEPLAPPAPPPSAATPAELAGLLRDVRIFRARLADALAAAAPALLRELACAVLGRELLLGPHDLSALAARLIREHPDAAPLRLRIAPGDTPPDGALPVVVDDALAAGDLVIELVDGTIDARLGVRLETVLQAWT